MQDSGFGGVVGGADESLEEGVSISSASLRDIQKKKYFISGELRFKERTHTLFATVPLILAINTILPPFPNRIICLAAAWAVMKHPVTFTLIIRSQSCAV